MNLLILRPEDIVRDNRAEISDRRAEHIRGILKSRPGDNLKTGLLNGKMGLAEITAINHSTVELDLRLDTPPPPPSPVSLLVAMSRPPTVKKILRLATNMGVKRIHFVNTARTEKSYWQSPVLHPEKIRGELLLGLEQAVDTIIPEVFLHQRFRPFIEDELTEIADDEIRLVAHPEHATECPRGVHGKTIAAIGPEGGFVDFEIKTLLNTGFTAVNLGPRVLRVELAAAAILARLA